MVVHEHACVAFEISIFSHFNLYLLPLPWDCFPFFFFFFFFLTDVVSKQ